MAVLKHTSPTAAPSAPKPRPQITLPSASTNTPVAPSGAGVSWASAMGAGTPENWPEGLTMSLSPSG
jgi:hypothetical protein